MAQFRFVMRSGPAVGKVYPLEAQEITIGRDSATSMVAINDAQVSRRHARMELRGNAYVIQDLGSTNGTFVNGTRISGMQVLNPGDTVAFGEGIVLAFEPAVDSNATILSGQSAQTLIPKPAPVAAPAPAPVYRPTPAPAPAPAPVYRPTPAPAPAAPSQAYSGQVPAGPLPMPPAATPKKKKFPVWIIIVIVLLLIVCVCGVFFLIIDQFKLWCTVLPFLVPLLGGTC
jgi:predicted component of type VI protein secretion system